MRRFARFLRRQHDRTARPVRRAGRHDLCRHGAAEEQRRDDPAEEQRSHRREGEEQLADRSRRRRGEARQGAAGEDRRHGEERDQRRKRDHGRRLRRPTLRRQRGERRRAGHRARSQWPSAHADLRQAATWHCARTTTPAQPRSSAMPARPVRPPRSVAARATSWATRTRSSTTGRTPARARPTTCATNGTGVTAIYGWRNDALGTGGTGRLPRLRLRNRRLAARGRAAGGSALSSVQRKKVGSPSV